MKNLKLKSKTLNVQSMFIALSILALLNSCAALPAQKVTLSKESVQELRLITSKPKQASRSARFLQCVRNMNYEGIKQSLLIKVCESAMGSIRD